MEKYKITPTGIFEKVHTDTNGTPFILIKGEFLKELGFYESTKIEILTQHDELILHNAEKYEPIKRTNTEKQTMINDISNLAYDLITSEIPEDEATKAWEYMDSLTDELEKQMIGDEKCDILTNVLKRIESHVDDVCTCDIPVCIAIEETDDTEGVDLNDIELPDYLQVNIDFLRGWHK
jgi:hypothetical protein